MASEKLKSGPPVTARRFMDPADLGRVSEFINSQRKEEPKTAGAAERPAVSVLEPAERADYENTMRILKENGLRPLTYQEALVKIDQNPELKEQLKGKWFWLDGKGSALSGYHTFNEKGELTQGQGDIEKTVYAYSGNNPLSLGVRTDVSARGVEGRFDLDALVDPSDVAPVVVGVHDVA